MPLLSTLSTNESRRTPSSSSGSSRFRSRARSGLAVLLVAAAAGSGTFAAPRIAHAEEVSPDGKGIVGGALLGAEVVVFIEALAGVRSGTVYALSAAGGAVAGGLGGFALERAVDDGRVPAYLLAGGLALIIPALVVTLDQTRYLPSDGAREDKPTTLPPSDPGKPGGSSVVGAEAPQPTPGTPPAGTTPTGNPPSGTTPGPAPTTPATPPAGGGSGGTQAPLSLFDVKGNVFRVGVPVPEVRPTFTANERKALGVQSAGSELRFPVVRVTF